MALLPQPNPRVLFKQRKPLSTDTCIAEEEIVLTFLVLMTLLVKQQVVS